eukprot:4560349-Pleurochrysis_carterae.AAC.4
MELPVRFSYHALVPCPCMFGDPASGGDQLGVLCLSWLELPASGSSWPADDGSPSHGKHTHATGFSISACQLRTGFLQFAWPGIRVAFSLLLLPDCELSAACR